MKVQSWVLSVFLAGLLVSCAASGQRVREVPVDKSVEGVSGVGIESQDIDKMTKEMLKDLLAQDFVIEAEEPPRIIVDNRRFVNESSQIINTNLLADRLRVSLIRNSKGSFVFLSRENFDAVLDESKITNNLKILPADYRLTGRITSISGFSNKTGVKSNFVQIAYELIDLKTSEIVWSNFYEVKKVGADDTIYR